MKLKQYEEGLVKIMAPDLDLYRVGKHVEPAWAPVFYNPRMALSRDIGVAVIAAYLRDKAEAVIVEPLSATGIRGIRYSVEVAPNHTIILNDICKEAYDLIRLNVKLNGVKRGMVYNTDANLLLSYLAFKGPKPDVIDLDPFGSPIPFLDSAIRALRNGGLLCMTFTDLPPLLGTYPKTCKRKYGATSLRTEYSKELGVRIVIAYVAREVAKYGKYVSPLLMQATDHYIRAYFLVNRGRENAISMLEKLGYVYHCYKCLYRELSKGYNPRLSCPVCGNKLAIAGPLWTGDLWDAGFLKLVLEEYASRKYLSSRGFKVLKLIEGEVGAPPLYFKTDTLAGKYSLREEPSRRKLVAILLERGYKASLTHFDQKGFRCSLHPAKIVEMLNR